MVLIGAHFLLILFKDYAPCLQSKLCYVNWLYNSLQTFFKTYSIPPVSVVNHNSLWIAKWKKGVLIAALEWSVTVHLGRGWVCTTTVQFKFGRTVKKNNIKSQMNNSGCPFMDFQHTFVQVTVCSTWDCWYSHSHTLWLSSDADKPTFRSTTRSLKSYSQS